MRHEIRVWTRDLLIAIGLALVIIVFLYQPVKVEGTSMAPLLSDQERIFINKFVYRFEAIHRGDVVVFWYPLDRSKSFIKRVIALPGETVSIRQGVVTVNGKVVPEPYVPPQYEDVSDYGPVRVPKDSYFVMGDHRISSNDSRVFGPVASRFIYGARSVCVLAGGPFRFAGDVGNGSEYQIVAAARSFRTSMRKTGGATERSAASTRDTRAGRRAHI